MTRPEDPKCDMQLQLRSGSETTKRKRLLCVTDFLQARIKTEVAEEHKVKAPTYAAQSEAALTFQLLDIGCGIVSIHNALVLLEVPMHISVVAGAFMMLKGGDLNGGLSPAELHDLVSMLLQHAPCGLQCILVEPATVQVLQPGSLIHVSGTALAHTCLPELFQEVPGPDSHIVMVESVEHSTITVINPDVGTSGGDQQWGRFVISHADLMRVWRTVRHDLSETCRAAVILQARIT